VSGSAEPGQVHLKTLGDNPRDHADDLPLCGVQPLEQRLPQAIAWPGAVRRSTPGRPVR
jgi:hypothetical protein